MPFRDKDWEDFQRDCDFFPAYTDYIFGIDTRVQVIQEPGLHPQIYPQLVSASYETAAVTPPRTQCTTSGTVDMDWKHQRSALNVSRRNAFSSTPRTGPEASPFASPPVFPSNGGTGQQTGVSSQFEPSLHSKKTNITQTQWSQSRKIGTPSLMEVLLV